MYYVLNDAVNRLGKSRLVEKYAHLGCYTGYLQLLPARENLHLECPLLVQLKESSGRNEDYLVEF